MCITQALLSTYEFSLKNSRAGYTRELVVFPRRWVLHSPHSVSALPPGTAFDSTRNTFRNNGEAGTLVAALAASETRDD